MRQAGFEAAKKAGDAKAKARTDALDAMKAKDDKLKKLDSSALPGMPPPSGTTEAGDTIKGDDEKTTVAGKADDVAATDTEVFEGKGLGVQIPTSKEAEAAANESILEDKSHIVLVGHGQTPVGGSPVSEISEEGYEALKRVESGGSGLKQVLSATDGGEDLPGKKSQDHGAGEAAGVGTSVAD